VSDRGFVVALVGLCLCSVIGTAGLVVLSALELPIPPSLSAVVGTCIGSIAGLVHPRHPDSPASRPQATPTHSEQDRKG